MGYHYSSRKSAAMIMQSISEDFHQQLLKHIKENDSKIGIIVDGSTDSSGNHFVTVLFEILEQVSLISVTQRKQFSIFVNVLNFVITEFSNLPYV